MSDTRTPDIDIALIGDAVVREPGRRLRPPA